MTDCNSIARRLLAVAAAVTLVTGVGVGQAQLPVFVDQVSTRLIMPNVTTDPDEKDFETGDLDNDGDLDLVCVRKEAFYAPGPRTHFLLMNVNGVLTDMTSALAPGFLTPTLARKPIIGDFNGDGWLDVIVVNTNTEPPNAPTSFQTDYYRNLGSVGGVWQGLLLEPGHVPTFNPVPRFCAGSAGDIDNDGDLDLMLGDYNNTLEDRLLLNNGAGFFTDVTSTRLANPSSNFSVEINFADFNGDGWKDIAESDGTAGLMKLHVNNGAGGFNTMLQVSANATYVSAVGDLDGDGKVDIYQGRDPQDAYSLNTTSPYPTSGNPTFATFALNTNAGQPGFSPNTTGFSGNAYVITMNGKRYVALDDTDVDIPGCSRHAVLLTVHPNDPIILTDDYAQAGITPNIYTTGTHDTAFIDLNNDGALDFIVGNCVGYHVFMQVPPAPTFTLDISKPSTGVLDFSISNAAPNQVVYTLVSTTPLTPAGSGPFFGLDVSAFTNFIALYGIPPLTATTNASGAYHQQIPGLNFPITLQARSVQIVGATTSLTDVDTQQFP